MARSDRGFFAVTGPLEDHCLYRNWPCAICGVPMAYAATYVPGEPHFFAATLTEPSAFRPDQHFSHEEAPRWCRIDNALTRYTSAALREALL